ncbi:MAG TPA: hypothetical protein ENG94_01185, partial [Actinobacteria bacterium]|nr:hypothetical protein [Actinomycetota bacterium]
MGLGALRRGETMPAPFPEEFRRRAVELARERPKPVRQLAEDLGISESCLRRRCASTVLIVLR